MIAPEGSPDDDQIYYQVLKTDNFRRGLVEVRHLEAAPAWIRLGKSITNFKTLVSGLAKHIPEAYLK